MIHTAHVHHPYIALQTGKWWENITRLSAQHRCCLSTVSPWSSTWPKVFGPKKMCSLRPNIKMVDEAFNKFVVFPQPIGIWHRQGHLFRESFTIVSDTILSIYEHSIQQRGLDQLCSSWLPFSIEWILIRFSLLSTIGLNVLSPFCDHFGLVWKSLRHIMHIVQCTTFRILEICFPLFGTMFMFVTNPLEIWYFERICHRKMFTT